jgi:hypothetical protein
VAPVDEVLWPLGTGAAGAHWATQAVERYCAWPGSSCRAQRPGPRPRRLSNASPRPVGQHSPGLRENCSCEATRKGR